MKDPTYKPTYPLIDLQPDTPLRVIYDTVETHLLRQGERSANEDSCMYRGPDGMACAVGCLIEDADVREGVNVHGLGGACRKLPFAALDLLMDLQMIHDQHPVEAWPLLLEGLKP